MQNLWQFLSIFDCLFESPQHQSCNFLILSPGSQLCRCSHQQDSWHVYIIAVTYGSFAVGIDPQETDPITELHPTISEDRPVATIALLEWPPCVCCLARITAELYWKAVICHLSSYWKCRTKDLPSRLETNGAPRGQSGSIGPSCKCQDRWLNSTQNENRKFPHISDGP